MERRSGNLETDSDEHESDGRVDQSKIDRKPLDDISHNHRMHIVLDGSGDAADVRGADSAKDQRNAI